MMVFNYVKKELGQGNCFAPQRKQWILTAATTAASLASSIFGGSKAAQAANAAERRQRKQEAQEDAWYRRRYNEDYSDTAAGQNLIRRAKEYANENWRKAAGAQAVAGGTATAAQMAKDAGNKMVGDTIADMAATDQQRKTHADDMHRQAQAQFAQMDMQREQQRAQNITTAAQNASNAIMQAGSALEGSTNLKGGDNKGTPLDPNVVSTAKANMGKIGDGWQRDAFGRVIGGV